MKAFLKDIFHYHSQINKQLIQLIEEEKDKIDHHTIALLLHSINAHHIWNARIVARQPQLDVHKKYSLQEAKKIDRENYAETLNILENFDLETSIAYTNSKQKQFRNTVVEILYHIANHYSHHRGQIMMRIRQCGLEPIPTDYIFLKRK